MAMISAMLGVEDVAAIQWINKAKAGKYANEIFKLCPSCWISWTRSSFSQNVKKGIGPADYMVLGDLEGLL